MLLFLIILFIKFSKMVQYIKPIKFVCIHIIYSNVFNIKKI